MKEQQAKELRTGSGRVIYLDAGGNVRRTKMDGKRRPYDYLADVSKAEFEAIYDEGGE